MHTYTHLPTSQPAAPLNQTFTPFHSLNERPPTPEPALSGSSSSISDSSSTLTTKATSDDTSASSTESVSSVGRMNPPRKPQLQGHDQQHTGVISPQTAEYHAPAAPETPRAYPQAPGSGMATPLPTATPSVPPGNYFRDPSAAPFPAAGPPHPLEHRLNYPLGPLASTAQAPSYAMRPPFHDQVPGNEIASHSMPHGQAHAYHQQRVRDEALNIPPEQQYEEYMHNPGSLGLAAALYHDSQSQSGLLQPQQPLELIGPSSTRSSETPPRPSDPPQQAAYSAAYNPYEQHGLVPTQGYYASDLHLLQVQGASVPSIPAIPGFALVHPGNLGQAMLAAASPGQPPPQARVYAQQAHSYDSVAHKKAGEPRRGVRGRNRSTMRYHECTVCGKRFGRPSALQTHVYSHTGEKPYKCDIDDCARCFSVLSNLRRHQRVHHGPGGAPGSPVQNTHHFPSQPPGQPPGQPPQDEKDF